MRDHEAVFAEEEAQEVLKSKVKKPIMDILGGEDRKTGIRGLLQLFLELRMIYKVIRGELPEPTEENTWHPNTHILIEFRDKFFEYEFNPVRAKVFRVLWNLLIIHYDHSGYYRYRLDWVLEMLVGAVLEKRWMPRPPGRPKPFHWREHWETDTVREDILGGKVLRSVLREIMSDDNEGVIAVGDPCLSCGGEIEKLNQLDHSRMHMGRCSQCEKKFVIIRES